MRALLPVALVALVLALPPAVSGQVVDWTRQFGTAAVDLARGISVDASGVYVAGRTSGALPGQTSSGGEDAFVRKYDAAGTELWTRQFGTALGDAAEGISVVASGVYVAGAAGAALPGQTYLGDNDAFVRKYDAAGAELWTREFGTSGYEAVQGVSADASGVYVGGSVRTALPGQTSSGDYDAYVRKYDPAGTEVWTRQFGTSGSDATVEISVDASGVYVSGYVGGALPGYTYGGLGDVFVRKYDAAGTELWTRQFGTASGDQATGISVDASGLYVTGATGGALPGQTSSGDYDAFVRKYDAAGTELWTRQFGTALFDFAFGISADASGVYVAGAAGGALPAQTSSGSDDAFAREYDAAGNAVWTRQFGTSAFDVARGISVDASGVYVAGEVGGALPGQTSSGGVDAFVVKLSLGEPPETVLTVPSAPLNLAAVAGNQQVTLTWDPPSEDGGSAITNYTVYRDTVPGLGFNEWANKAPATAPIARIGHAMAYDTGSGKVVLFGGFGGGTGIDETGGDTGTWVYDVAANTWTIKSPSPTPSPRDHHAMAYEAASGKVVLFGGRVSGGSAPNAETWVYDVAANTWTDKAPATAPSARFGHAMAYDAASGKVVLFGGGVATVNDETWVYDLAANTWTIKSPSPAPSARYHHEMAYDAASGKVVLFGGDLIGSHNDETWVYDLAANTWTIKSPSPAPSARAGHAMAYDAANGKVVLFGGQAHGGALLSDTWVYSYATNAWTNLNPPDGPSPRRSHAMAYDAGSGKVVLFGGDMGGGVANGETWVYPPATPLATLGIVFAYTDPGLTNGVTYYYRVAARNAMGLGPASNQVSASPVLIDVEPPTVAVPANIVTSTDPGNASAVVTFVATATDNAPGVTVACSPPSGFAFPIGTTTVTCTATDASGNTATASFNVTVTDVEPPTVAVPDNNVTSTDPGNATAVVTYPTPTASDNSGGVVVVCTPPSGSTFPLGVTTVTCTSTDPSGNTATASFTVTVSDIEPPTVAVPANILVSTDPGSAFAVVAYTVIATDNAPGVTVACSPPSGFAFPIGPTTVTCTVTDASGNTAAASFTVTVTDVEPPTITVPSDILVSTDPGSAFAVVTYAASAADNVGVASFACVPASGSTFPLGATLVTCTAADAAGNMASASFTVTVVDVTPPDTSITSAVDGNGDSLSVAESTLSTSITFTFTGTDNVGVAGFECRLDGGAFSACDSPKGYPGLSAGAHTFEVRAVDPSGNVEPTPASFAWIILTPAEGTSELIDEINAMGLPQSVAKSLTAPLEDAHKKLTDSNPNNDMTACGKLKDFIDQVNAKENSGRLTLAQAAQLREAAQDVMAALGC